MFPAPHNYCANNSAQECIYLLNNGLGKILIGMLMVGVVLGGFWIYEKIAESTKSTEVKDA